MKLLKKPTAAQQAILTLLAQGAVIVIQPPNRQPRYAVTDADTTVRAVTARTIASLSFNGWIWSGPDRPSFVITNRGRATLAR